MPLTIGSIVNSIICGEAKQVLEQFPGESIDCVVTSPPYWALRHYGVAGQLGLELSFHDYISDLCSIFDEVRRVLKKQGTCWVNLGDTYSTVSGSMGNGGPNHKLLSEPADKAIGFRQPTTALPDKCLVQIPSRFALEMVSRAWILRNEIIWHKPNCMPSSAADRFTVDFEKLFFFVKSGRYYFEQQFEALRDRGRLARRPFNPDNRKRKRVYGDRRAAAINPQAAEAGRRRVLERGRNKRAVWRIATRPFRENHFAVYPPQLIETPIMAGCPEGGIVLDPFLGSGTTALAARWLRRNYIGIDLNPAYVQMARRRLSQRILF